MGFPCRFFIGMTDRDNNLGGQNKSAPRWKTDASPQIIARAMKGEILSFSPDEGMPRRLRMDYPDCPQGQGSQNTRGGWIRLGIDGDLPSGVGATGALKKRMRYVTREDMV